MNTFTLQSPNDRILFVNITKTYNCLDPQSIYYREDLYEMTRKYWKVSLQNTKIITHVIGHSNGIIKEVITHPKWQLTNHPDYPKRLECTGIKDDKSPYIGMNIHNIIPTGQNPVRYYKIETKKK